MAAQQHISTSQRNFHDFSSPTFHRGHADPQFGREHPGVLRPAVSWKASGLVSVDGVLYLSISRHHYPDERKPFAHFIEETWDASIIKSTDHGTNWTATPEIGKAMFPGRLFSNPLLRSARPGRKRQNEQRRRVYLCYIERWRLEQRQRNDPRPGPARSDRQARRA
jgi:hypothetical protein